MLPVLAIILAIYLSAENQQVEARANIKVGDTLLIPTTSSLIPVSRALSADEPLLLSGYGGGKKKKKKKKKYGKFKQIKHLFFI